MSGLRAAILGVGLMLGAAGLPGAMIFDLGADWSDASNPNGPWTYREGLNAVPSVADWTPLGAAAVQPAWAPSATTGNFLPAWFQSTTNNPGGFDILIGDVVVHSTDAANGGGNGVGNVIWTSPVAGSVDISGGVWIARDIGRGNDWRLLLNGALITGGNVFSGDPFDRASPFDFSAGSGGAAALLDIPVAVGDVIELEVERTSTSGDFVGVNLTIEATAVPEPTSLALFAAGFGALLLSRRRRLD